MKPQSCSKPQQRAGCSEKKQKALKNTTVERSSEADAFQSCMRLLVAQSCRSSLCFSVGKCGQGKIWCVLHQLGLPCHIHLKSTGLPWLAKLLWFCSWAKKRHTRIQSKLYKCRVGILTRCCKAGHCEVGSDSQELGGIGKQVWYLQRYHNSQHLRRRLRQSGILSKTCMASIRQLDVSVLMSECWNPSLIVFLHVFLNVSLVIAS